MIEPMPRSPKLIRLPRDKGAIARERKHWWQPGQFSPFFQDHLMSDYQDSLYWKGRAKKRMSLEEDNQEEG